MVRLGPLAALLNTGLCICGLEIGRKEVPRSRAGLLILGTADISGWRIPCCGGLCCASLGGGKSCPPPRLQVEHCCSRVQSQDYEIRTVGMPRTVPSTQPALRGVLKK